MITAVCAMGLRGRLARGVQGLRFGRKRPDPKAIAMVLRAFVMLLGLGVAALAPVAGLAEGVGASTVAPEIATLSKTLMIGRVMDVMRSEGLKQSAGLSKELLAGQSDAAWRAVIEVVYDTNRMTARFDAALAAALGSDARVVADSEAFFGGAIGQRVLALEIEARLALLDDATETAAKDAWDKLVASNPARADQIGRFATVNDLIESNVMGALNANLAFYRGLSAAGGFGDPMPEDQMLTEVWTQEQDIRRETTDWLFPFLMLSYRPLTQPELQAYIDFSATDSGKKLNAAMFLAFDAVMADLSRDLGAAAGRLMAGQDI